MCVVNYLLLFGNFKFCRLDVDSDYTIIQPVFLKAGLDTTCLVWPMYFQSYFELSWLNRRHCEIKLTLFSSLLTEKFNNLQFKYCQGLIKNLPSLKFKH